MRTKIFNTLFKKISILLVLSTFILPSFFTYAQSGTVTVSNLTGNTATISAQITSPDNNEIELVWTKNGEAYDPINIKQGILSSTGAITFTPITGLTPNTLYNFSINDAVGHMGIAGASGQFTTLPVEPTAGEVSTGSAQVIFDSFTATDTSAVIKIKVITNNQTIGLKAKYGTELGQLNIVGQEFWQGSSTASNPTDVTATINSLTRDTIYYYEIINTSTNEVYFTSYFKTASGPGVTVEGNENFFGGIATCPKGEYCLLVPLPGFGSSINTNTTSVGSYLGIILKIAIALAGVLAVVMIVVGGIQYMSTDSMGEKAGGKERMTNAILGLLMALGSYALLNTINPDLLNINININKVTIGVDPEIHGDVPHAPVDGKYCSENLPENQAWSPPDDSTERSALSAVGVTVNKDNCPFVGSSNCTSVKSLSSVAIQKLGTLKSECTASSSSCEVVVTGGTECWLHSRKTAHLPGNPIVDIRSTNIPLVNYLTTNSTITQDSKTGWKIYKIKSGPLSGATLVNEGDHFHVKSW